jgi:hypothetical protein
MEPNASMQLRDIKPLVEIEDSSFYLYWGLILLGLVAVMIVGYFLYQKFKIIQKVHREKEYLEVLNSIDWSSPKKAAYRATHYGRLLATDERREALFSQLLPLLERYKYKKETQRVDDETIGQFELYRRICNESV